MWPLLALSAWVGAASADEIGGDAARGREIYEAVCAHCHTTDYDGKFGPGLRGVLERVDENWLDRWLKNPQAVIDSGDEYAVSLRESNEYGLTMPAIPAMQDPQARADVIAFLKTLRGD
ncbi:MAG: cytochrome c [Mariprofundaceae bacterium]